MSIKSFSEAQAQAAYNAELNAPAALIDAWSEILPLQSGLTLNSGGSISDFDIGSGYHSAATNMGKIFLPLQYIPMCIPENYHNFDPRFVDIMIKYVAGFTLAHEIGHNNIHPGQSAGSWAAALKDIPVDYSDKVIWMNFISDIMVNYNVNNATALSGGVSQKDKENYILNTTLGNHVSMFLRSQNNLADMEEVLAAGRTYTGEPIRDNREVKGELKDDAPLWHYYSGFGRGQQYFPSLAHSLAENHSKEYLQVRPRTSGNPNEVNLSAAKSYTVVDVETFDGKKINDLKNEANSAGNAPYNLLPYYQPIAKIKIKNGMLGATWYEARYFDDVCPLSGKVMWGASIWNYWVQSETKQSWDSKVRGDDNRAQIVHLLCNEWGGYYANYGFDGKTGYAAADAWIEAFAPVMHGIFRYE